MRFLADLNVVARINVPARNHAVNLDDIVAIPPIQLGLCEIAVGRFELGFGLLDRRSDRRELSEDPLL